jgi:putative transposase
MTEKRAKKKAAKKAQKLAQRAGVAPKEGQKTGRPKGSKNKPKTGDDIEKEEIAYTFQVLNTILGRFVSLLAPLFATLISIKYVVGDGGFGNNTVAKIVRTQGFELISKLQYNAALYLPFQGEYGGRGRPKSYGDKLDYDHLEEQLKDYLVEKRKQTDGSIDHIFHIKNMVHKSFEMPLNVVIILRFDKNGIAKSHKSRAILFSTDMEADYNTIIDVYHVRFQIEFNFRDARQFFGLSNFKNIKKQQVQNVIGYAFFMVSLSNILIFEIKQKQPECPISIQDLKAFFRAEKYINELLNRDEFKASLLINRNTFDNFPIIGTINARA